jgi:hypothetical protein
VCEDGSYFILNYVYTHGDGESEKKKCIEYVYSKRDGDPVGLKHAVQ